jgi:methyl-accepting chemotaxis protein
VLSLILLDPAASLPLRRNQPMSKYSGLERKMLSYFGLIAAASLLITVEFVWVINEAAPSASAVSASSSQTTNTASQKMEALKSKAFLMGIVQAVVTFIVMLMFMRRITGPLQEMVEETEKISDGDLSRTIVIKSKDEIGMIGETINGLTSNIQEIVGLSLLTDESVRENLFELRSMIRDPEAEKKLDEIEARLDFLRDIAMEFKLSAPPSVQE